MVEIVFDRPELNRNTPEQNLAIVDRWIADTSDKLNYLVELMNRGETNGVQNNSEG